MEINNCKSIIIDKSIKPVIMADAGYNFPSSVHIQPFNGELILVVANHTKEPDKRRHLKTVSKTEESKYFYGSVYFGLKIIMYQVINFSS